MLNWDRLDEALASCRQDRAPPIVLLSTARALREASLVVSRPDVGVNRTHRIFLMANANKCICSNAASLVDGACRTERTGQEMGC